MPICYVIEDVPEEELESVKDSVRADNCEPRVTETEPSKYKVEAVCDD